MEASILFKDSAKEKYKEQLNISRILGVTDTKIPIQNDIGDMAGEIDKFYITEEGCIELFDKEINSVNVPKSINSVSINNGYVHRMNVEIGSSFKLMDTGSFYTEYSCSIMEIDVGESKSIELSLFGKVGHLIIKAEHLCFVRVYGYMTAGLIDINDNVFIISCSDIIELLKHQRIEISRYELNYMKTHVSEMKKMGHGFGIKEYIKSIKNSDKMNIRVIGAEIDDGGEIYLILRSISGALYKLHIATNDKIALELFNKAKASYREDAPINLGAEVRVNGV